MGDILNFRITVIYDEAAKYQAALRDQDIFRKHSKGYPAKQDPAAEKPCGILKQDVSEADLHKYRQHYGPAFVGPPVR
ncbi:MAG: hypothetical protein DI626_03900 [Micavibrio aeruginosavorus]|uniref:Uncharacterized protein n=1 Tax=Micavibrio aeruginosavorus TaxID=349221 RepID=A0A2W5BWI0_9BACT|nr:MAG: hypothetical protein DI626_03900 [Micavibrio aeruginosavorus]